MYEVIRKIANCLKQILKKICDHPLLLTKRAAEDVLEGMDSMLNSEDAGMAEKLAMHVADVAETDDFQDNHDNLSCKISFLLSLLVRLQLHIDIFWFKLLVYRLMPWGNNLVYKSNAFYAILQDTLIPRGHHVLIFSQTRKMLNLIQVFFKTLTF